MKTVWLTLGAWLTTFNNLTTLTPKRLARILGFLILLALVYAALSIGDARLIERKSYLEDDLSIAVQTEDSLQARASELDGSAHITATASENGLQPGADDRLIGGKNEK